MMRRFLGLCALNMCFALSANATTLIYKSFDDLVVQSQAVVVGTVMTQEVVRNANGNIVTLVTLDQLQLEKGQYSSSQLTLQFFGGQIDGEYEQVEGMPVLKTGQRYIMFVRGNGTELAPLVGWEQGIFHIAEEGGKSVVEYTDGRNVVAIQNNSVVAERAASGAVEIVGAPNIMQKAHSASPSVPVSGNNVVSVSSRVASAAAPLPAMEANQFLSRIRDKLAASAKGAPMGVADVAEIKSIRPADIQNQQSPYLLGGGAALPPPTAQSRQ